MTLRRLLPLGLLLAVAACRPADPPPSPDATAPEATMPDTALVDPSAAAPEGTTPEVATEVREHPLTVREVQRYGRAAENLHQLAADDPELRRLEEDLEARLSRATSIEEVQQILDEHPRVQEALRSAGLSSRDYVLTGTALLGAYSYVLMREQGIPEPYRPDYVTDEHVRFVEQNRAEVDAVVARLQALYGDEIDEYLGETG